MPYSEEKSLLKSTYLSSFLSFFDKNPQKNLVDSYKHSTFAPA